MPVRGRSLWQIPRWYLIAECRWFPVPAFTLIGDDCSISGSAIGNPSELRTLRKFAGRSKVAPTTELFPMSQINEALKHVREGKARYRAVLKADL